MALSEKRTFLSMLKKLGLKFYIMIQPVSDLTPKQAEYVSFPVDAASTVQSLFLDFLYPE